MSDSLPPGARQDRDFAIGILRRQQRTLSERAFRGVQIVAELLKSFLHAFRACCRTHGIGSRLTATGIEWNRGWGDQRAYFGAAEARTGWSARRTNGNGAHRAVVVHNRTHSLIIDQNPVRDA